MAWWSRAVFYECYVRSFQDSNGDGVGDLNGLAARLDYLADLGVDAIWIAPFYPSPQIDFGYDISDHEAIDPIFGSLADFDRLVAAAHRRHLRVVVDLVLNHTSDRHRWFESSRTSRGSPYRDWYVWRDGRAAEAPPNNWESAFGGPAWTYDARTEQWYYHAFYPQQPDLNWRNPDVERRMLETVDFWLDRGVDGFRLDAVNTLFEDEALRDNPPLDEPRVKLTGVYTQQFVHTRGLPAIHGVLRRLRAHVDRRQADVLLVSEAYVDAVEELIRFYGGDDEMHLPFNFFLAQVAARDAGAFRRAADEVERAIGAAWPSLVLGNHDIDRACDRYADGADPDRVAKLLAAMLLTLRGTPFIYYGEELAMRTDPPSTIDEVRDPAGRPFWPRYKGRDGVRRPMRWNGGVGAGFTTGTPWLALSPGEERSVEHQRDDPRSVLNFYRALLAARRAHPALVAGSYRSIAAGADVFAYVRAQDDERLLVALNMADAPRQMSRAGGILARAGRVLVGTDRADGDPVPLDVLPLAPLEAVVIAVDP